MSFDKSDLSVETLKFFKETHCVFYVEEKKVYDVNHGLLDEVVFIVIVAQ